MSYPRSIDEYSDKELCQEIQRRNDNRRKGLCPYCGYSITKHLQCKYPEQHATGEVIKLKEFVQAEAEGIPCNHCGGHAPRVEVTEDEELTWGCGRPTCCSRAFVCKVCGTRMVGRAIAPEMEIDD